MGQPRKHLSVALIFGIDLAQPHTKAKFIKSEADTENQESVTNEEKTSTNESEDIKETQEMQDSQELWVFRYMKKEHKVPIYKYD